MNEREEFEAAWSEKVANIPNYHWDGIKEMCFDFWQAARSTPMAGAEPPKQGEAVQAERIEHQCETCDGQGTIDERLGGEWNSNPKAECPDCDGKGYWIAQADPEPLDKAEAAPALAQQIKELGNEGRPRVDAALLQRDGPRTEGGGSPGVRQEAVRVAEISSRTGSESVRDSGADSPEVCAVPSPSVEPAPPLRSDWRLVAAQFMRDEAASARQYARMFQATAPTAEDAFERVAGKLEMLSAASPYGLDCISPPPQQVEPGWQPIESAQLKHDLQVWALLPCGRITRAVYIETEFREHRDLDGHYVGQDDLFAGWIDLGYGDHAGGDEVEPVKWQPFVAPKEPKP